MKKITVIIFAFISLLSFVRPATVAAQSSIQQEDAFNQLNAAAGQQGAGLGERTDPRTLVARFIRIGLSLLGTIFLCLTVYAGFLWMTAGGNEEQAGKARRLLYDAVIGLAIVLAAYSLTYFVSRLLVSSTGTSTQNQNQPDYCLENPFAEQCQG